MTTNHISTVPELVDPPKRVTGGVHQYPVSEERNPIG
jgi:hypothetical protein